MQHQSFHLAQELVNLSQWAGHLFFENNVLLEYS